MEKHCEFLTSFDEHLEKRYGPIGSEKRTEFEIKASVFANNEIRKEENKEPIINNIRYAKTISYQTV